MRSIRLEKIMWHVDFIIFTGKVMEFSELFKGGTYLFTKAKTARFSTMILIPKPTKSDLSAKISSL